ncbi:swr1 complex component [Recurvomyces mirabilis]|uniref:DNA helicase n=1 Tax=Recurvomyces mirabilis TaxID=574656 RepID=A0AAE0WF74_9PEZI|nr:swr1 complex component [Recurvomyces mirabilis]KAK5160304.1 swr1 complex component [Recurvomyces mirabilis]
MSATLESGQTPPLDHEADADDDVQQQLLNDAQVSHDETRDERDTIATHHTTNGVSANDVDVDAIKVEDVLGTQEHVDDANETTTTLRPAPPPSNKRRESETVDGLVTSGSERPSKKRKRAVSPPWQFGTVQSSTIKGADGRRISARHTTSTPGLSESDGPGRSTSLSLGRSRPPSPPWKKFEAEGPSSVQVDGMRKSGRVNKEVVQGPTRTSPRQKKQIEWLEEEVRVKARPVSRGKAVSKDLENAGMDKSAKGRRSLSPASRIADLQAQIAALQPTPSVLSSPEIERKPKTTSHKRKRSDDVKPRETGPLTPTAQRKPGRPRKDTALDALSRPTPRLKLRFNASRQLIPVPHPLAQTSPPALPPKLSLHQVIEPFELQELQQPYMDKDSGPPDADELRSRHEKAAILEAGSRRKILQAAQPGGVLSRQVCSLFHDEQQSEPTKQYGHVDHLATQVLYFRSLQQREKNQHRALAKKVAYEALEQWKYRRGPTEEDVMAEQNRTLHLIYKQVVLDVRGKWEMVAAHVEMLRKQRWENEEAARRQERLEKQLATATAMIARQRGDDDGSGEDMGDFEDDDDAEDSGEGEDDEESLEENMSDEDEVEEADGLDDGGELTGEDLAAYIKATKTDPPDKDESTTRSLAEKDIDVLVDAQGFGKTVDLSDPRDLQNTITQPSTAAAAARDHVVNSAVVNRERTTDAREFDRTSHNSRCGNDADDEEAQYINALGKKAPHSKDQEATKAARNESSPRIKSRRQTGNSLVSDIDTQDEDAGLNLSDDESEDMYDSDDDMSSSEDGNEEGSESAETESEDGDAIQSSSLALLFGNKQMKEITLGLPTPTTSAEGDMRDQTAEPVSDDNDVQAGAAEVVESGETITAASGEGDDMELTQEVVKSTSAPQSPSSGEPLASTLKHMVPIPSLLRGTLRSYQHAGLDWLASLHRNGTNGILADEMGLGKTIQTIALLAHLAEEKQIWDPHLVIVPTSVVLNWVNEFHKFLPGFRVLAYFGSQEERAIKRRGWTNDPHHEDRDKRGYNVIVTSYNVAMADINAIRNLKWHYLVLDEAHNIRNFQSQRWQLLIRLKTKARLLLTGTPLQNSLTELWSLLTFLTAGDDDPAHGDLEEFLSHWKEPVKEIFDRGVTSLSNEAQKVVDQLHVSLRPFLLRRLKNEVEKDLPKKTESVVVCKLSKRQRELYQEYMSLASTRESLTKGNAVSAGRVLLSLRRVCNHPDLFDPRTIDTSFALDNSPAEGFAVKENLIRRLLGEEAASATGLIVTSFEGRGKASLKRARQLDASGQLRLQAQKLEQAPTAAPDTFSISGSLALKKHQSRQSKIQQLRNSIQATTTSFGHSPIYGSDLRELLTVKLGKPYVVKHLRRRPQENTKHMRAWPAVGSRPLSLEHRSDFVMAHCTSLQQDVMSLKGYSEKMHALITRFAFVPPKATAPLLEQVIPSRSQEQLRTSEVYPADLDFAHESRVRTTIAFPDSKLLIYDSGKLQRLAVLLRDLQSRGSRSLIFTQMTFTLDILERFLNLLNLPYLRLDGQTPTERRMLYSSEFNRPDSKYQCMILSSRAGGVGLNLTGASSVIFYDLDWNPQMDRQCMDRAHRIGQVRDVEVYKMVSEKTVEENILRRANQKSLLDQAVIQEGHFTTEYQREPAGPADGTEADQDDVSAAIERFLGVSDKSANQAIASVEDVEDVKAAEAARKEENQDAEEFVERLTQGHSAAPAIPGPGALTGAGEDEDRKGHIDGWMVEIMEKLLKDVPFVPPVGRKLDKHGRDPSHRPKRKRG